jgi:hypothetical protein
VAHFGLGRDTTNEEAGSPPPPGWSAYCRTDSRRQPAVSLRPESMLTPDVRFPFSLAHNCRGTYSEQGPLSEGSTDLWIDRMGAPLKP